MPAAQSEVNGNPTLQVTFFDRLSSTTPRSGTMPFDQPHLVTASKAAVSLWSPASYPDGAARANANVHSLSAFVIDLDGVPSATVGEVVLRLSGIEFAAHTTFSNAPESGVECWRLIVPFEKPVPVSDWARCWSQLRDRFAPEMDPACCDAGRMYFLPTAHPDRSEEALAFSAPGERLSWAATAVPAPEPAAIAATAIAEVNVARVVDATELLVAPWAIAEGMGIRHKAALALGGAMKSSGVCLEEAELLITELTSHSQDREAGDRLTAVRSSYASQDPTLGWATMRTILPPDIVDAVRRMYASQGPTPDLLTANGSEDRWNLLGFEDLWGDVPETDWLVKELDIAPGAPTMLAGYGFSGKTMAAQSLAVSVATGLPYWGMGQLHDATPGKVLHLDFEQGRKLTARRYQRLAEGLKAPLDMLRENLRVASLPRAKLDDPTAEAELTQMCAGVRLVIVDSLRAAAPTLDENSSDVRRTLDLMTRVSEVTGAAFLVIHHAKKSGGERRGLESARGSSAIFDGCSSVLILDAEGEGAERAAIRVTHVKARNTGVCAKAFEICINDTASGGLVIDAHAPEQRAGAAEAKVAEVCEVLAVAGPDGLTKTQVVAKLRGRTEVKRQAVQLAIDEGRAHLLSGRIRLIEPIIG